MAKNSIRDYSSTASSNTDVQSVDIDEQCAASGINNAIREVMADLKDVSTGAVALESPSADSLTVTGDLTVDTNTLYVDSTNNRVGVGTTAGDAGASLTINKSPVAAHGNPLLQVGGSTFTSGGYYTIGLGYTNSTYTEPPAEISYISQSDSGGTKGSIVFGTRDVTTNTAVTERMRIDSSGRLIINDTSSGGDALTVYNYLLSGSQYGIQVRGNAQSYTQYGMRFYDSYNTAIVGSITYNTTTVSYNTSSDYRLKTNVTYDWDATTRLKQLRPARFEWIADGDDAVPVDGFLAHEVQDIVPEAISGTKDAVDADGNPEYQGIDQSKLVPLLVKTIQELEARITALETA